MEKTEYINLSSSELKQLIAQKKKEIYILETYCWEVERKEHNEKYIAVKVEGCKGCKLEHFPYATTCDHCDGWHYEDKLR